ncbi:ROK family transcriptional regulator protein (plasmid) [Rhizobium etli 8C-3]|uniref:ROK family transcriptional regulator protein n=1 Tax=Rhizobium etli 8C-3 TaxID=538025 RepID=A0A1L5PAJ8_RHIET|nr:ROK family transcriptional regulator [Rhizobium etli]APO77201.1 ROK family transcriptional regulator protein [Rhizobium etli 8C-3]
MIPQRPLKPIMRRFMRLHSDESIASGNERLILRELWKQPLISRAELASRLPYTQQALHKTIDNLSARGIVSLGPPKPAAGRGQPSPTLSLSEDWAFTIGISVNTDQIGVTVMRLSGRHETAEIDIVGKTRDASLDQVSALIEKMLREHGLDRANLLGVGFAIAGYRVEGTAFNAPIPLQDWSLIQLEPLLSSRLDAPVWTENAANTAAICEAMLGVGRHVPDFCYLSFNYGFGGALIIAGELVTGSFGNAGEFSGIYEEHEDNRRPALQNLIRHLAQHGIHLSSVGHLRKSFDPSWEGVAEWVEDVLPVYNRIINAICSIIDPQAIVFGGQIPPRLAEMFVTGTKIAHVPRYGVSRPIAKLIVSDLSGNPSAIGAAALPFKATLL